MPFGLPIIILYLSGEFCMLHATLFHSIEMSLVQIQSVAFLSNVATSYTNLKVINS